MPRSLFVPTVRSSSASPVVLVVPVALLLACALRKGTRLKALRSPRAAHCRADLRLRTSSMRRMLGPIHWSKDGSAYLTLENAKGGKGREHRPS